MIEPAIPRIQPLPAIACSADEALAERVLIGIIAALAAVLVPGHAGRLVDTPLTWADIGRAVRPWRRATLVSRSGQEQPAWRGLRSATPMAFQQRPSCNTRSSKPATNGIGGGPARSLWRQGLGAVGVGASQVSTSSTA